MTYLHVKPTSNRTPSAPRVFRISSSKSEEPREKTVGSPCSMLRRDVLSMSTNRFCSGLVHSEGGNQAREGDVNTADWRYWTAVLLEARISMLLSIVRR